MGLPSEVSAFALGGGTSYQIERSLRLRRSASAYLNRTFSTAPTLSTRYTLSFWIKRGQLSVNQGVFSARQSASPYELLTFEAGDTLFWQSNNGLGVRTSMVFRDPGAWYNILLQTDTTQATAADRSRMYVNGAQVTYSSATYPTQNSAAGFGSAIANWIGGEHNGSGITSFLDGYLAEIHFIDGQALTPSAFGYTDTQTGVWMPKAYVGTYGTNGYYLKFNDPATTATLCLDRSGNGNNWTPNNISVTLGTTYDSMLDSPTNYADGGNGRGNYATLNNLVRPAASVTWSEGNLKGSPGGSSIRVGYSSIVVTSGKWYCEVSPTGSDCTIGVLKPSVFADTNSMGFLPTEFTYAGSGVKYSNNVATAYGASYTNGDVIGIALDLDNGRVWFSKNGTFQASGDPAAGTNAAFTGLTGDYAFSAGDGSSAAQTAEFFFNFGQRPFAYTPPSGFRALNTQNLPQPFIARGNSWMDATTYSGNSTIQNVVNSGAMQPDLVWIKNRSGATDHIVNDTARGAGAYLITNLTNAETTNTIIFSAFNSNGFQLNNAAQTNASGSSYVGWQWKEGVLPGFDIVTYTGTGVGGFTTPQNLGVTPSFIIVKKRSAVGAWSVYHQNIGTNNYLLLNTTDASAAASGWISVSSTTFGNPTFYSGSINDSGATYVAYVFATVPGFSAFGSYTGNGSADGRFVWCGFRPRWLMIKSSTLAESWQLFDTARSPENVANELLQPNTAGAEQTSFNALDLLSNGFKIRDANSAWNGNGATYVFAAFAENPFKIARAR